jgi:hypothetical protein
MEKIEQYKKMGERKWKDGACSGCVYGANEILEDLNVSVYKKFTWTNVLHADIWPDVRKMVIAIFFLTLVFDKKNTKIKSMTGFAFVFERNLKLYVNIISYFLLTQVLRIIPN